MSRPKPDPRTRTAAAALLVAAAVTAGCVSSRAVSLDATPSDTIPPPIAPPAIPDLGPAEAWLPDGSPPDTTPPRGKPTPGFGDLCRRGEPCKPDLLCVYLYGRTTFGFCTLACAGPSDILCKRSRPLSMHPGVDARCDIYIGRNPVCGFFCEHGEPCPRGFTCGRRGAADGLCRPDRPADGGTP